MSYRIQSKPKPHPHRSLVDVTTPAHVFVHNGTIAHLAFPCWYQEVHKPLRAHRHNRHLHDHRGWPSPSHPDHICQLWVPDKHCCSIGLHHECSPHCRHYIDLTGIMPIHLINEGYTSIRLAFNASDEVPDTGDIEIQEAYIDPDDDWVVRVTLFAHDFDGLYEPAKYKMTVFALADASEHGPARRDIVALTDLIILPSGYILEENDDYTE